jgi:anti-sigma B factor antagonist
MPLMSLTTGEDGTLGVTLRGEIDFSNASEINDRIRAAVNRERPTFVRVEMADVTFLDSSGIGVLVTAMRAADEIQAGYRVEHPSPKVYDQLRMTGLLEVFGLTEPPPEE